MCSVRILILPDFAAPFEIETDTCQTGVGVVLQRGGHLIAFFSKTLRKANQKFSTYKKELLAMLIAVD
jgi:hypothetical protein